MTSSTSELNDESFVLSSAVSTAKTIKYKFFSRPSETSISLRLKWVHIKTIFSTQSGIMILKSAQNASHFVMKNWTRKLCKMLSTFLIEVSCAFGKM